MNIKKATIKAAQELQCAGVCQPYLEARILLTSTLQQPLEYLLSNSDLLMSATEKRHFAQAVSRRIKHEPIAYIIGYKEFYGHNFIINHKVLIPRPESEILVDIACNLLAERSKCCLTTSFDKNISILDLGTGSGCIAITLLLEVDGVSATAVDICNDALSIAQNNAVFHKVDSKLILLQSDWFDKVPQKCFDLIISNPPYVAVYEENLMSLETLKYEPTIALFADNEDELSSYKAIAQRAKYFLTQGGVLLIEVGFQQADRIIALFKEAGYILKKSYNDLSGHIRVLQF